jgi:hypothetical protein
MLIRPALCNLCGERCGCDHESTLGLINHTVAGGYCSTPGNGCGALDDCALYSFSLCEFCLDWLFTQFKTPPKVGAYSGMAPDEPEVFRPAAQRVAEDAWRERKAYFLAEAERRAKLRERGAE